MFHLRESCLIVQLLFWISPIFARPAAIASFASVNNTDAYPLRPSKISIQCFRIFNTPSDFSCHEAFEEFASTLRDDIQYHIARLPTRFRHNIVTPKKRRAGLCEFRLVSTPTVVSLAVTGADLKEYGRDLLNRCVADESHSSGGKMWVQYRSKVPVVGPESWLGFQFEDSRNVDVDGGNSTGEGPGGQKSNATTF